MLGLGGSLTSGVYVEGDTLMSSYTSDFTSDADGWSNYSVEGDPGLTLAAGENAPGESSNDWLKGTYDTNQTNNSGIMRVNLLGTNRAIGDYAIISYKIYFVDDNGKWTGSDTDVRFIFSVVGRNNAFTVDMDETVSTANHETIPAIAPNYGRSAIVIFSTVKDYPLDGAVFYIKDISIKVYRPV